MIDQDKKNGNNIISEVNKISSGTEISSTADSESESIVSASSETDVEEAVGSPADSGKTEEEAAAGSEETAENSSGSTDGITGNATAGSEKRAPAHSLKNGKREKGRKKKEKKKREKAEEKKTGSGDEDEQQFDFFTSAEGFEAREQVFSTKDMSLRRHFRWPGRLFKTLIIVGQALVSVLLVQAVFSSGLVPQRYLPVAAMVLIALFALTLALILRRSRARIVGCVVGIALIAGMGAGTWLMTQTNSVLDYMGVSYKTTDMLLLVRKDDAATSLKDARNYTIGIQTGTDEENTQKMLQEINSDLNAQVTTKSYNSSSEVAAALMNGEVDAAVMNQAYASMLYESYDGFKDGTRSIYKHVILTEMENEQVAAGEPFNILISGIDVDGSISQDSRSDTNIIITVNPKTHQILLTTTPRDYFVQIPGVSGSRRDKLTHAGIYGIDASMNTLEQLYGIDISYYLRVNFSTLMNIVDAIGGVDVYSDYSFQAYTDSGVYINRGWTHMDGRTALAFCRERYSLPNGDNDRGKNQQAVLKAILQKVMSPSILINASDLLNSLEGSFQTNMTTSKLMELVNQQMSEGSEWTIQRQAAQGTGDYQMTYSAGGYILYVMWPDEDSVRQNTARIQMFLNAESSEEETSSSGTTDTPAQ